MDLKVFKKTVYGIDKLYPVCEKSGLFCALAGTKTLTEEMLKKIKKLGFTISLVDNFNLESWTDGSV